MTGRLIRVIWATTVVLCLLVALVLIVAHTGSVRRFAVNRAITMLADRQIELSTDGLSYNLLTGSFDLRNLRLRSTRTPDMPVVVTATRARINVNLLQLLRGRYVVQSGTVEGLDVHYFVDGAGRDNLPNPPSDPNAPRSSVSLLISSLSVSDAFIRYENRQERIDVSAPFPSLDVNGDALTDRHRIRFATTSGQLRLREFAGAIDRLDGNVNLGAYDVRFEPLQLDTSGMRAELGGSISWREAASADLTVKAIVDSMRAATTLLDNPDPVEGQISVAGTAKGPFKALVANGRVSGSDLRFRDVRNAQLDVTGAYDLGNERADIATLLLAGPWGRVHARGNLSFEGTGASDLQAEIESLDAAALMQGLRLPYAAASRVNGTVRARWPGTDYLRASGAADIRLAPTVTAATRSTMPVGGRVVARGINGRLDAQLEEIVAAGIRLTGRIAVTGRRGLEGQLKGRAEDVGQVASSFGRFFGRPSGSILPMPVAGALDLDAMLGGSIDTPSATAAIMGPALTAGSVSDIGLHADLSYQSDALTISSADLMWRRAIARMDGVVELARARRLDLRMTANDFDVPSLVAAFNAPAAPVSGVLSAQGTVGGTLDTPMATVAVKGADLAAYQEVIGTLDARLDLAGRQLTLSTLTLDKPQPGGNGRLSAHGTYDLDDTRYTLDVQSDQLQLVGLALPDGKRVRGNVQLSAQGAGTVDAPKGNVALVLDPLEVDGLAVRAASSGVEAAPASDLGRLTVDVVAGNGTATVKAVADHFNLNADALVDVMRPWPATVTVRAQNLELGALPIDTGAPLEGQLQATLEASLDLAEPAGAEATLSIDALDGSWNGRPFAVKNPSMVKYHDERLALDSFVVTANDSTLTARGDLPLTDRAGEGVVDIDLEGNLASLAAYLPPEANLAADGRLMLTGSLRGTLKAIAPDLMLTVENGLILSPTLEPGLSGIGLAAHIENGEAIIERLSANWGTATLRASGRIPLEVVPPLPVEIPRMGGPATVTASITGLDPSAIPGANASLSGRISVDAELSATRAELAALEGIVTFPELAVAVEGLELAQEQTSTVTIRAGTATVDRFSLTGSAGTISAAGQVGFTGTRALDVSVDGNLNVGAVSVVTDKVRAEGDSTLKLRAQGTVDDPQFSGTVTVSHTTAALDEPNIAAENLEARVELNGREVRLSSLTADVNGGTVTASGSFELAQGDVQNVDLQMRTRGFAFDAPLDLRSISDADLTMASRGEDVLISGRVRVREAGLTGDIDFDTGLLAAINSRRRLDLTEDRSSLLDRIRFDVDVNTTSPVLVDNNIARAEINANLKVIGTPDQPALTGRLRILEGGEIRLNERRYEVERGDIHFIDERRIVPDFDLRLNTTASNYDITIAVTGPPGDTETTLTSDPTLPEPDIMAMLVTGRTLDDMRGAEYEVARDQVLSYLAGRVGSTLGRGLQRATGFSEVRLEPTLIANEADPSARLTVAQELTDELKLVYSTNLAGSNDQIWIAEYDVTRRFQTRAVRQADDSYRLDFRHDVRFGGQASPRRQRRARPTLDDLVVTSDMGENVAEFQDMFSLREGDPYDFFTVQKGVQQIERALMERGYLQSRVRVERDQERRRVSLQVRVTRGPLVELRFEGANPPASVLDEIRTQWHRGVFDKQRADDGAEALREWLMDDNYLQPRVEYRISDMAGDRRQAVFTINPGPRYSRVVLAFEGASGVSADELDQIVEQQRLERQLFTDPIVVTELLERYYREQGYLVAEIDEPRYEYQQPTARIVLTVREGPQFTVRHLTTSGNTTYTRAALAAQLPLTEGGRYLPAAAERSLERIRDLYWDRGFNDVRSDYSLVVDRAIGQVDISFTIAEGRRSVVEDIRIAGNRRVNERVIRRQIELMAARPLDLSALARSRRNLYDTGAFSVVNITPTEVEPAPAVATTDSASSGQNEPAPGEKPVVLNVRLREVQPIQLRYGASYDTERGIGGIFDVSSHNTLGHARVVGLQSRYDGQLREARVYFNEPPVQRLPATTTASLYFREELNPPTELTDAFDTSRKGVSVQQEMKLRDNYVWTYGYRYERAHRLLPSSLGIIDQRVIVSPLTSTLTRDTRDDVLDAAKGFFLSQAFSYSPQWLGSDSDYMKFYVQYFQYVPLQAPKRKPLTNEILRPRLVYAAGVRLGLARGLGGTVPASERFFAGGSATLRGFAQNAVGPIGLDRVPEGGQAMLVINNELRAPLFSIVDGVLFADIGNVFGSVRDLSFTDLRQSAGIGIRVRTPWLLLRGDYGVVLDTRPGERRGRFYFSVGQAF